MAQFNSQEVRSTFSRRGKRVYYAYGEDLYAGTFPEEWAQDHAPGTGPSECEDCRVRGGWNGVFMLYCANCAINVYNGERGKGAISPGQEIDSRENREYVSAFDTYLYDVNLNDVGDPDFRDSYGDIFNEHADKFSHLNPRDVIAAFARMTDELVCCDSEDEEYVDYYIDTNGNRQDVSEEPGSDAAAASLWDQCARRREHRQIMYDSDDDPVQADNDVDSCFRQCRDSRTVCYESDDNLPRQQYIPSNGECVPNSFDNASPSARSNDKQTSPGRNSLHVQRFGCGLSRQRGYEFDDLSNDEDDDDERSFNTQDSVPEPDMSLNETVYCLVCENTKYNCACGDIDDEDNLDIVRKTHQFCLDYHINQVDEHAILRQLGDATLPTQNIDIDEAEPDDVPLDENVHCMICENTKYNCACDEDLIHQSVFCYTCENPRYGCDCDEESRNKTHYCLHCEKVKYNCICVGENSVYLRVARKYCMLQRSEPVEDDEPEYATLVRFVPPNKV